MDFYAIHQLWRYTLLFAQLYIQVFLLYNILEAYDQHQNKPKKAKYTEKVSILVPCFNEAKTVTKTVDSLLELHYRKKDLIIIVVDDGSTDNTWEILQQYKDNPQVEILQKENQGSKYHALNYALEHATTEFIGCLDADSRVDPEALKEIIAQFDSKEVRAVVPSMMIESPKTILQHMQKVEYEISIFMRQALAASNSLYVAPGPFSIFRKEVFEELGNYAFAHHTEDLELALRIQESGGTIAYARNAIVYTLGPAKLRPLIKQRVRWLTGFLRNMIDYKRMLFRKKHGDLGLIVLPYAIFALVSFVYTAPIMISQIYNVIAKQLATSTAVNGTTITSSLYMNTHAFSLLAVSAIILVSIAIIFGRRVSRVRLISLDLLTLIIYPAIATIWSLKSLYDVLLKKKVTWR